MHPLVQMQHVTRKEFLRGLQGLADEDARKRIESMNCISWIVGHLAWQEHLLFVAWPQGKEIEPQYRPYGFGAPPAQPPLEEVMELWHATCDAADAWLHVADEESMQQLFTARDAVTAGENAGTLIVRNIFHYWCHIGEISAVRQMLGHRPPQFVNLHDWSYGGE